MSLRDKLAEYYDLNGKLPSSFIKEIVQNKKTVADSSVKLPQSLKNRGVLQLALDDSRINSHTKEKIATSILQGNVDIVEKQKVTDRDTNPKFIDDISWAELEANRNRSYKPPINFLEVKSSPVKIKPMNPKELLDNYHKLPKETIYHFGNKSYPVLVDNHIVSGNIRRHITSVNSIYDLSANSFLSKSQYSQEFTDSLTDNNYGFLKDTYLENNQNPNQISYVNRQILNDSIKQQKKDTIEKLKQDNHNLKQLAEIKKEQEQYDLISKVSVRKKVHDFRRVSSIHHT